MVTPPVIPDTLLWTIILFGWGFWLISYGWLAFCLHLIANKTNTPNPWLAWIPITNIYLMCKVADKSGWLTLLFFVPLVNIVVSIIVWMGIAKSLKMPSWLGILTLIPYLHFIIIGVLAFAGKRVNE